MDARLSAAGTKCIMYTTYSSNGSCERGKRRGKRARGRRRPGRADERAPWVWLLHDAADGDEAVPWDPGPGALSDVVGPGSDEVRPSTSSAYCCRICRCFFVRDLSARSSAQSIKRKIGRYHVPWDGDVEGNEEIAFLAPVHRRDAPAFQNALLALLRTARHPDVYFSI